MLSKSKNANGLLRLFAFFLFIAHYFADLYFFNWVFCLIFVSPMCARVYTCVYGCLIISS
jgi:hypothetical protein